MSAPDGRFRPVTRNEFYGIHPHSFFSLFRFATKFELFLNFAGLVCAAAAGSAQPLAVLFLSKITAQFTEFIVVLNESKTGRPDAIAAVPVAASAFRSKSSQDAKYLVYIGLGTLICTFVYMNVWVHTAEVNAKRIREQYLKAVLRQDAEFFDEFGVGEIAMNIDTGTHLVQQAISEKVPLIVLFFSSLVTGFILAYVWNWRLALALTPILPCIAIAGYVTNVFASKYTQLSLQHSAEGRGLAQEVFSTIRTAKAFETEVTLRHLYDSQVEHSREFDLKAAVWEAGGLSVFYFAIYAAFALTFSFGTTLLTTGRATDRQIIGVFEAILLGSSASVMIAPEIRAISRGRGAAAKIFAAIDRVPNIDSSDPAGQKPERVIGEIELEDIQFSYPSRPDVKVLRGLSMVFRAGKTSALVGPSGSGKSTIASLLERFYDPAVGSVKLDGVNLKDLNVKWLRSQIGLVSQEPTLFSTTIKENIVHGLIGTTYEHAPDEDKFALIKDACFKANADDFIANLPFGYDTVVGERGFLLSGGQRQRIAIARAIVSNPRILILDEATSALDTRSESIVQSALNKACIGRTTIIIAHRLSTIKDADNIFVINDGFLIEQGCHDELFALKGAYARLVRAQNIQEYVKDDDVDDVTTVGSTGTEEVFKLEESVRHPGSICHSPVSVFEKPRQIGETVGYDHGFLYLFYRLGKLNRERWTSYIFGSIIAIMTGMVYPALGVVYAKGIIGFTSPRDEEKRLQGNRTALRFFVITIFAALAFASQNYLFSSATATLTSKLRRLSFEAVLKQDISFFDKDENNTGNLASGINDKSQKINGLFGIALGVLIQGIATLAIGWLGGLHFSWKLGGVAIACGPLLIGAGYIRLHVVVQKDQANKKLHEKSAQLACEAAGAIQTVASLTREEDCCEQYRISLEEALIRSDRTAIWSNSLYAFAQSTIFLVIALVFWYGTVLVSRQELSTFQFFACVVSSVFASSQAGNLFTFVPDFSAAKSAASDVIKLIDSIPKSGTNLKKITSEKAHGCIRFDNVNFQYPARAGVPVLRGLSLQAESGSYVALVGASGCGKSTAVQLIERFYDPSSGEILLDDQPISQINISEYRKHIALVSQEPTLYAGTIRFNILLGATKPESEVTEEEIENACRDANVLDFIQSLPNGFETEVGGKGSRFSVGQRQRIAIARALIRNPKILLLDEATSALDSNSESIVQAALDQAAKGRTTIAIAHRLSTIQKADRIYFIKNGRVSESGTHNELLMKKGDYCEYVTLQTLKSSKSESLTG